MSCWYRTLKEKKNVCWRLTVALSLTLPHHKKKAHRDDFNTTTKGCTMKLKETTYTVRAMDLEKKLNKISWSENSIFIFNQKTKFIKKS